MRSALQIQKEVLCELSEGEISLRELEIRLNTNYNTVRAHCEMLKFYGVIETTRHERSDANGRPYTTVKLTDRGRGIVRARGLLIRK